MGIASRLRQVREHARMKQEEMAEFLDISPRSWQDYERGKSMPGGKVFERLSALRYNVNWIFTGEGVMRLDPWEVCESQMKYNSGVDMEKDYILVPRYCVEVSAGGGSLVDSEQVVDHLAFKTQWIRSTMALNPSDIFLVSAVGDSMIPTIAPGDLLLVDKSQRDVRDDAVYVLLYDGSLMAKRLQKLYDGQLRITSDNQVYEAQLVPKEKIELLNIIGRVVWCGRRM